MADYCAEVSNEDVALGKRGHGQPPVSKSKPKPV